MTGMHVFIHCEGRFHHLLRLHILGVLPGNPIPPEYKVHSVEYSERQGSLNLVMTNGGGPIPAEQLALQISRLGIFGREIKAGTFGEPVILPDP